MRALGEHALLLLERHHYRDYNNICGYYFHEGEDSWSAGWSNTEVESITEEEYNEIYASEVEFDTENIVDIYWFSNVTQEDINLSYCTFADSVG